jgi:type I restriction enzyme R subunit
MERILFMQSKNFEFLRPANETLANLAGLAEAVLHVDPGSTLTRLRAFAEELVKSVYKEERLPREPQASFYDLVRNPVFQDATSRSLVHQINFLRIQGNDTAHGAKGDLRNAHMAMGTAHQLAMYVGIKYYGVKRDSLVPFENIQDPSSELAKLKTSLTAYQKQLEEQEALTQKIIEERDAADAKHPATLTSPTPEALQQRKAASQQIADSLQWNEDKTRKLIIDAMLLQAGWDVTDANQVGIEVKVDFPDNVSGKGYCDYVLWGDNGQPLAVIEAKKTGTVSTQAGREQARLYADSFVSMGKQRPVIFYTNGYETFIWDDQQYNTYRPIYGLYTKDSLDYLIYQRQFRKPDLEQHNPDTNIAGRPYQIEAIKAVAHKFQLQRRKALMVKATGTGKTRVAIALSELLLRTGWAKRVLFLCDRKELRTQSDEAFKDFLPSEPRCVIGESSKIDQSARIYISTYPGMMNRFAQLDVGFFDLIIADESHRSIYNKYRDLFDYFDSLQLGLTATPVKFLARDTFGMFDCDKTDPTFEYSLEDAISNEPPYLCSFRVKDLTTEFLREGIHYNDLDKEQQKQLEEDLGEDIAKDTRIAGKDIGRKIFSKETDRIIIENLMNNGLKDETGSLVGKTIIFAQRQDHAEHLEKMFCEMYPQHGVKVCKVIHNKVPKVESLIREFKKEGSDFRIAISVDMLDTGIDVPEVVNLVFAKPVRSWVKFWQMIGRGTRLCENLFGPGKDKSEFLIFDHYSNFDYFNEEYTETEETGSKSLLQTAFKARLELLNAAIKQNSAPALDAARELIRADIADLPEESIAVKRELRTVHQLLQSDALQSMNAKTLHTLESTIAPLMSARVLKDKHAIQLDRLMAAIQTCWVHNASCFEEGRLQLMEDIDKLAVTIQAVRRQDKLIAQLRTPEYWASTDIDQLEHARKELRGIMKYRQQPSTGGYATPTTGTQDGDVKEIERPMEFGTQAEALQYRRRLKEVLDGMVDTNPILQKIKQGQSCREEELQQLTSTILTTSPSANLNVLNEFYGRTADQLHLTLLELVGMEPEKVEAHFTAFLHNHPRLTAKQVTFMNLLKNYLAKHGTITIEKLYQVPFTSLSHEGIDGVFSTDDVGELVGVLKPFLAEPTPV